jgi:predicted nucleic acid-binding protein
MKLKNTHRGSKVVIDSNIFTHHLSGHSIFGGACKNFLKRVERGEYESYVDDVVLSEVLLNFVKSELFRLRGIKPHRVVQEIKGEPNLIGLVNFDVVTWLFENLRVEIPSLEYKCKEIVKFISGYFLLLRLLWTLQSSLSGSKSKRIENGH